ncbi:SDR family oxidoreductase [Halobacteriovorax sp. CON-3]|uniref:SDR family oxidoreductase n=1 Tax=Halobacteriovorax sp. CON-3 TaxID=3157710 RepID=UPI00371F2F8F
MTEQRTKTILIFGISSFVGSSLASFLKKDYKIVGTYHKNPVSIDGITTVPCDIHSKQEVQLIMYTFKPDITIYAIGLSSIVDCALSERRADALNTSGLFTVADICQRYKSQIIYLSSNFVFSGESSENFELDIPDPTTTYGKTQAAAEFYIQKSSLNYLVFRVCRLYGRGGVHVRKNLFEKIQAKLHAREEIELDDYIKTGFLDIDYLGMVIKICVERGLKNRLLQISSNDFMSTYAFGKLYCQKFQEPGKLISSGKWPYPIMSSAKVSDNSSGVLNFNMNITNAEGYLHLRLPSVEESLEYSVQKLRVGLDAKEAHESKDTINYI